MDYDDVVKFLFELKGSEEKGKGYNLDLRNIKLLLKRLGNPHKKLKVIHVAGTNGKGSVCSMISSILVEQGYKIGMYTSPHLVDFRERFQVDGKKISKKELVNYFKKIKKHVDGQTFFEVITAMGFLYFKEQKVDYLVLEVGLGGRLDATNVVDPLISVITNISKEHTELLGKNLGKIAFEKAGIIKKNKPVVTGASGVALKAIKDAAKKKKSKVYLAKNYEKINGGFNINGYKGIKLRLKGDFQLMNAALAITAVDVLRLKYGVRIDNGSVKKALLKTRCPGRFELIEKNVLVDCAHNEASALVLKKELLKLDKKIIFVIGILKGKRYCRMLKTFSDVSKEIILTQPKIERAVEPEKLSLCLKKRLKIIKDVRKAVEYAKKSKRLVVVTGSTYTVRESLR